VTTSSWDVIIAIDTLHFTWRTRFRDSFSIPKEAKNGEGKAKPGGKFLTRPALGQRQAKLEIHLLVFIHLGGKLRTHEPRKFRGEGETQSVVPSVRTRLVLAPESLKQMWHVGGDQIGGPITKMHLQPAFLRGGMDSERRARDRILDSIRT
jgi:hypothetical protein